MKLYLISQTINNDWDTFEAAVVCAPSELTAQNMNPDSGEPMTDGDWQNRFPSWCSSPKEVTVKYIGEATDGIKQGVVLASFKAG